MTNVITIGPSEALRAIKAKTDQESDTDLTLSLVQHGLDAAAVAGWLFDHWLPEKVLNDLTSFLGDRDSARALSCFLAGSHDVGKATAAFEIKLTHDGDRFGVRGGLEDAGFTFPPGRGGAAGLEPHCRIGQMVAERWMTERFLAKPRPRNALAAIIGAHHGVPPGSAQLDALAGSDWACTTLEPKGSGGRWKVAQDEFLDLMLDQTGAREALSRALEKPLPVTLQAVLSGAVIVADWLASDPRRFPYDQALPDEQRLSEAHLERDLPGPWRPEVPDPDADLINARFGFVQPVTPNAAQQTLMSMAHACEAPPLLVFEAPTGSGKTEGALMAAEVLAARFGCGGVQFLLPTRGTTNALYERMLAWISRLPGQGIQSSSLAHGKALLNRTFSDLARQNKYGGIFDNYSEGSGKGDCTTTAFVSSWFMGRRKNVLASMVAGTVDQLLLSALKARFVTLRHLGLAGKVVIVDECHAADAFMLIYLCRALEWLGAQGIPTIVMSATLPSATRQRLITAYSGQEQIPDMRPSPVRITAVAGDAISTTAPKLDVFNRPIFPLFLGDDTRDLEREVVAAVEAGACVAVIRNTVDRAQAAYESLTRKLGAARTTLLHSRFLAVHREAREEELRRRLGPGADDRPRGFVVVATQVLEVSLDIDVDLMITDIAPADILFQRAGRLHRHRRGEDESERPGDFRTARLLITGCSSVTLDEAPTLEPGSANVYGAYLLLATMSALYRVVGQPVRLSDVPVLVDEVYSSPTPPNEWAEAWERARVAHEQLDADKEARASAFALESPKRVRDLTGLLEHSTAEPEDDSEIGAQVRDSEESLDVIAVRLIDGLAYPLPKCGMAAAERSGIPTELDSPSLSDARMLAQCTVTLPPRLTRFPSQFQRTLAGLEAMGAHFTGWQLSPFLRGELILPLNENSECKLAGHTVRYDMELGLCATPDSEDVP